MRPVFGQADAVPGEPVRAVIPQAGGVIADLSDAFELQRQSCASMGSTFSATLLAGCVADLSTQGPVARLFAPPDEPTGALLPLRLLGAVHRLVLERRAPLLALHYPSVGGDGDPFAAWPAFRSVVEEHSAWIKVAMRQPPQTNEVGRSALLVGGLYRALEQYALPIRLFELGASAGLNLRCDQFRISGAGRSVGPSDADVVLEDAWVGNVPDCKQSLDIVERRGFDLSPIDPTTTDGRLGLTSYVWPDDRERLRRLRAALRTAARFPADVERADLMDVVMTLEPRPQHLTVIWHSTALMYLDRERRERALSRINALGAQARPAAPVAHLSFEPARRSPRVFPLRLRTWPNGYDAVIAESGPHGLPTTWR